MIRIGICAPIQRILDVERYGFDYIEGNLTELTRMGDAEFEALCELVSGAKIRVEAFNCLLPGELRVTGDGVNARALHEYLDRAFSRAKRLGGEVVVFGSGGARHVPEGFPTDQAWRQMANFLRLAERHLADHDLVMAIEPLRHQECNLLNYVTEAVMLASWVQLPHVRVLGDTYHMAMGHEPLTSFLMAGELLAHVHTANSIGRTYPKKGDGEDYGRFFRALTEAGYQGRVSVEGGTEQFDLDAPEAYQLLSEDRGGV